jgi:hypothetical protein
MEARSFDRGDPARRCTAHRKNGEQCRKWAILGGTVCATHGGAAKHVRNAARARLANAADRMAKELLRMATDDNVSDSVKLAAIRDALDRGGLGAKTEIELSAKPYEMLLDNVPKLQGGSRAEWRRSQGIPDDSDNREPPPALVAADDSPVDVEIVDDEPLSERQGDQQAYAYPTTPGERDWQPGEPLAGDGNPFGATDPPPDELLTLDEAVIRAARINNMGAAGHVKLHRPTRALPRGWGGR